MAPTTTTEPRSDTMSRPHQAAADTLSDRPSFQEAFEAAKKEHSTPTDEVAEEEAPQTEASTETEEADAQAPDVEAAKVPAAKVGKADLSSLLTDEEFTSLQTKHADNPVALRKSLEAAFTKKTQAVAEERRSMERLQPYAELIDAYETDPEATLSALAERHGLQLVRPGETTETGKTAETAATTQASTAEQLAEELRTELGEEYEYLVDPLSRALSKVADKLVDQRVKPAIEASTKPLKDQQERILSKAAAEETTAVMTAFGTKHPDWKDHEDAMFAIAQTLDPKGLGEIDYLERCYQLATRDAWEKDRDANIAAAVKKALAKVQKGADTTETQTRATPDSEVRLGPPVGRSPTFEEAHAAAKRGERWE